MGKTLIVAHGNCTFEQVISSLPKKWVTVFDEVGFLSNMRDYHDDMDDWLIECGAENLMATLAFDQPEEVLEYVGECLGNGEVVEVVSVGHSNFGENLIRSTFPELILSN